MRGALGLMTSRAPAAPTAGQTGELGAPTRSTGDSRLIAYSGAGAAVIASENASGPRCRHPHRPDEDSQDEPHLYRHARSAVMCISTVPWHAPLKISVCMVPESDPSSWGV